MFPPTTVVNEHGIRGNTLKGGGDLILQTGNNG